MVGELGTERTNEHTLYKFTHTGAHVQYSLHCPPYEQRYTLYTLVHSLRRLRTSLYLGMQLATVETSLLSSNLVGISGQQKIVAV